MERLKDKTAVITGAASGIGRATALLFAREGARVVCADLDVAGGQQTVKAIGELNGEAMFVRADVSRSDEVRRLAEECERHCAKVDTLFSNAGRAIWQGFEGTTEQTWAEMIDVNLTAAFLCAKHLLPLMKAAGEGSIINHASIDAILGNARIVAYSAAKGGLIPLTHTMARDLAQYNIRVNCICSGGILTALTAPLSDVQRQLTAVTPLRRLGTPEEVAYLALFLASEESSYVNGASIVIDGGRTGITQGTF